MGMGYAGWQAETFQDSDIEKLAPEEYKALKEFISMMNLDIDSVACACQDNDCEWMLQQDFGLEFGDAEKLIGLVDALQNSIKEKWGISVVLSYHNSADEGDRYDEIDGAYWDVSPDDLWEPTPEYKAIQALGICAQTLHAVHFG